ncbi:MAG TPA: hypothetical protein PKX92_06130 [Edaphocola sp.]|nr:hypothetical protein [Edaphocola sp.]
MKKNLILFIMLVLSTITYAQDRPSFTLTKGTVLTYNVEQGDNEYQFIMTITELDKGLSFDWKMTEPINRSGTVSMTSNAMKSATALFSYFKGGITKLTDETSAFVSTDVYNALKVGEKVTLSAYGKEGTLEEFDVMEPGHSENSGTFYMELTKPVNGTNYTFDSYILENADSGDNIRVWKNAKYPLILTMTTNFNIYLMSVEQ